jgi:hypothetical protein
MKKFYSTILFAAITIAFFSPSLTAGKNYKVSKGTEFTGLQSQKLCSVNTIYERMKCSVFSDQEFLKKRKFKKTSPFIAGFQGGYTVSIVTGDVDDQYVTTAFNFGLFGVYMLNANFGIQVDLNVDPKGWSKKIDVVNTQDKYVWTFSYITIPIMAKLVPGDNGNFFINIGPYLGFLTKAEQNWKHTVGTTTTETTLDIKDMMNSTDFGLTGGIGILIPVYDGSNFDAKFLFDLRLSTGLSNFNKDDSAGKANNQAAAVKIGIAVSPK